MSVISELAVTQIGRHVLRARINRPAKRNAVNAAVAAGIAETVARAEADPEIRVVILCSTGDHCFCAGADLVTLAAGERRALMTKTGGFAGLIRAERKKPWIAVVEAPAFGGGTEICFACDMIVASEAASFALPEVKIGLIAAAGGMFRAPRRLPPAVAYEMLATGAPIPAPRAYQLGLVNRLTPPGAAETEALALATQIAENAPLAVQLSLAVARRAVDADESALFAATREAATLIGNSEDFKEGPKAFLEKRKPVWTGR